MKVLLMTPRLQSTWSPTQSPQTTMDAMDGLMQALLEEQIENKTLDVPPFGDGQVGLAQAL